MSSSKSKRPASFLSPPPADEAPPAEKKTSAEADAPPAKKPFFFSNPLAAQPKRLPTQQYRAANDADGTKLSSLTAIVLSASNQVVHRRLDGAPVPKKMVAMIPLDVNCVGAPDAFAIGNLDVFLLETREKQDADAADPGADESQPKKKQKIRELVTTADATAVRLPDLRVSFYAESQKKGNDLEVAKLKPGAVIKVNDLCVNGGSVKDDKLGTMTNVGFVNARSFQVLQEAPENACDVPKAIRDFLKNPTLQAQSAYACYLATNGFENDTAPAQVTQKNAIKAVVDAACAGLSERLHDAASAADAQVAPFLYALAAKADKFADDPFKLETLFPTRKDNRPCMHLIQEGRSPLSFGEGADTHVFMAALDPAQGGGPGSAAFAALPSSFVVPWMIGVQKPAKGEMDAKDQQKTGAKADFLVLGVGDKYQLYEDFERGLNGALNSGVQGASVQLSLKNEGVKIGTDKFSKICTVLDEVYKGGVWAISARAFRTTGHELTVTFAATSGFEIDMRASLANCALLVSEEVVTKGLLDGAAAFTEPKSIKKEAIPLAKEARFDLETDYIEELTSRSWRLDELKAPAGTKVEYRAVFPGSFQLLQSDVSPTKDAEAGTEMLFKAAETAGYGVASQRNFSALGAFLRQEGVVWAVAV